MQFFVNIGNMGADGVVAYKKLFRYRLVILAAYQ